MHHKHVIFHFYPFFLLNFDWEGFGLFFFFFFLPSFGGGMGF